MTLPPDLERELRRLSSIDEVELEALVPLSDARARFVARVSHRSRAPVRRWMALAAAGLPLLAWVGVRLATVPEPISASVRKVAVAEQDWLSSRDDERLPIDFSDGSRVTLEPKSRARIVELTSDGATFAVESGEVSVEVVERREASWRFTAGPYGVRVTGTAFSVRFSPDQDLLELELREGSVVVSGCALGDARPLRAGELLTASCRDGRFEIARGATLLPRNRTRLPAEPEPAAALEPAAATEPGETTEPLARDTTAELAPQPPASAKNGLSGISTAAEAQRRRIESTAEGWEALARAGEYQRSLAQVTAMGFEAECERLDPARLALLADVARFGGSTDQALFALSTLRRRFAGGAAAGGAAFAIARIHFDQRAAYAEAARWFRAYLKEQPRGSLAREAQGRLMETLFRLGDRQGARDLARAYLEQTPNGPHARLARSLLEP